MAGERSSGSGPKTVREQIEDGAKDLWSSMKRASLAPREGCSADQEEMHKMSLESVVTVVFGACTSGVNPGVDEPPTTMRDMSPQKTRSNPNSLGSKADPDRLYRSLFADDYLRAEEAVAHLREQLDQQRKEARNVGPKEVPRMFPVSSPPRKKTELPTTIEPTNSGAMRDASFDDGISIITQNTLDLVAKEYEGDDILRVFSDVTQDPIEELEESWKQTVDPGFVPSSPHHLVRSSNRSHCTSHTKRSHGTKGTKSTQSTLTHEFANVWQREEQKYWDDVVKEEEKGFSALEAIVSTRQKKITRAREASRKARMLSSNRSSAEVSPI